MTSISTDTPSPTLERVEHLLAGVDRVLGGLVIALGILILVGWSMGRDAGFEGMIYLWLGAQLVGPIGSLFLVAGRAMRKGTPKRWWWQMAPLVYPVVFLGVLELLR